MGTTGKRSICLWIPERIYGRQVKILGLKISLKISGFLGEIVSAVAIVFLLKMNKIMVKLFSNRSLRSPPPRTLATPGAHQTPSGTPFVLL